MTLTTSNTRFQEKQMMKLKEKLDKFVKEKLVEFCDVLDIPISKANTRKVCRYLFTSEFARKFSITIQHIACTFLDLRIFLLCDVLLCSI